MPRHGEQLLRQPVRNIVPIKPQLPRVTGPINRVRIFTLKTSNPHMGDVQVEGDIAMQHGALVCEPADSKFMQNMLSAPLRVWHEDRPSTYMHATDDPEAFLAEVLRQYRGSYCWAEAVHDEQETHGG